MPNMPSLQALRAFDASARHMSFTKAAKELLLTQSAISRHIRNLEEFLGAPLFKRAYREIELTKEGEAYKQEICSVFRQIERATDRAMHRRRKQELHIHAHTYVATVWLVTRLRRFNELNPDIDFSLTASPRMDDYREETHGMIRSGTGEYALADKLFDVDLLPVCTPALAKRLKVPSDLHNVTLLHSINAPTNWPLWLAGVGATSVDPTRGFRFESTVMACAAARKGLGVAMTYRFLANEELRSRTLVAPFKMSVPANRAYYFVHLPQHENFEPLQKFRSWLLSECERGT